MYKSICTYFCSTLFFLAHQWAAAGVAAAEVTLICDSRYASTGSHGSFGSLMEICIS